MVDARRRDLAAALAGALLEGVWLRPSLTARAGTVFATAQEWLDDLAVEVLAAYVRPPVDRHRELAWFILGSPAFVGATTEAAAAGVVLRPVRHPVPAADMAVRRWGVPPLPGVGDLADLLGVDIAHLDWFADRRRLLDRAPEGGLHHYWSRWLGRHGTTPRLLEAPRPQLRAHQRRLLHEVLSLIPPHAAAHGFVRGRSALTGAAPHVGAAVVICLDLESFFASVRARRVHGVLRRAGYPEAVAHVLTALCCTATPAHVRRAMPEGGASDRRGRLLAHLRTPHLATGAPTSPHLANLAAYALDRRLSAYADRVGARYTRYADDLTFSGGDGLARAGAAVVAAVAHIAESEGFRINAGKTRVRTRAQRQEVTGIVVNEHPAVRRHEVDALRALIHNCVVHGPASQSSPDDRDLRSVLLGRIGWVQSLQPQRGAMLRAEFDRIRW